VVIRLVSGEEAFLKAVEADDDLRTYRSTRLLDHRFDDGMLPISTCSTSIWEKGVMFAFREGYLAMLQVRSPSTLFEDSIVRFLPAVEMKPRTLCSCQPVAFVISASVAPSVNRTARGFGTLGFGARYFALLRGPGRDSLSSAAARKTQGQDGVASPFS
jgi:hypothetical protein